MLRSLGRARMWTSARTSYAGLEEHVAARDEDLAAADHSSDHAGLGQRQIFERGGQHLRAGWQLFFFHAYKSMQSEIDKAMPDQIMSIQGRQFRKKGYWRAVRAAFGLTVWCVSEERIEASGDWGYSVLYRAEAKNGMSADGDGVCMASEKAERQRSVHNVRSHAHTRAFNRAVSNLVGFGEVSAEEVDRMSISRPR